MLLSELVSAVSVHDGLILSKFKKQDLIIKKNLLKQAAEAGYLEVVKWILEKNATAFPSLASMYQMAILAATQRGQESVLRACIQTGEWTQKNTVIFLITLYKCCKDGLMLHVYAETLGKLGYVLPRNFSTFSLERISVLLRDAQRDIGVFSEKINIQLDKEKILKACQKPVLSVTDGALLGYFKKRINAPSLWVSELSVEKKRIEVDRQLRSVLFEKVMFFFGGVTQTQEVKATLETIKAHQKFFLDPEMSIKDDISSDASLKNKTEFFMKVCHGLKDFADNSLISVWLGYSAGSFLSSSQEVADSVFEDGKKYNILKDVLTDLLVKHMILYAYLKAVKHGELNFYFGVLYSIVNHIEHYKGVEFLEETFFDKEELIDFAFDRLIAFILPRSIMQYSIQELQSRVKSAILSAAALKFSNPLIPIDERIKLYDALLFLDTISLKVVFQDKYVLPSGKIANSHEIKELFAIRKAFKREVFGETLESAYRVIHQAKDLEKSQGLYFCEDAQNAFLTLVKMFPVCPVELKKVYQIYLENAVSVIPLKTRYESANIGKSLRFYVFENALCAEVFSFLKEVGFQSVSECSVERIVKHFQKTKNVSFESDLLSVTKMKLQEWLSEFGLNDDYDDFVLSEMRGEPSLFPDYSSESRLSHNIYLTRKTEEIAEYRQNVRSAVDYAYINNELQYTLYSFYQRQRQLEGSQNLDQAVQALLHKVNRQVDAFLAQSNPMACSVERLEQLRQALIAYVQHPTLSLPTVLVRMNTAGNVEVVTEPRSLKRKHTELSFS